MSVHFDIIVKKAIDFRHYLHQNPELSWQEFETTKKIRLALDEANIAWRECTKTGTIATLAQDKKGKHIALRGDIDALPLVEQSGVDWSSQNQGVMHACGHDGHTSVLMATAWWLKENEDKLAGPVSLFFQPAEEGGHGAHEMIEQGALEGVDAIYGWHNWPAIPFGKAVCPEGSVMSANGTFNITLLGEGGHSSQPEKCKDPVLAACALGVNLQQIVSRLLSPHTPSVLSVTYIDAPSGPTIIPNKAKIGGSIRCSNTEVRDEMNEKIHMIAEQTAKTYGVDLEVDIRPRYPATVNDVEASRHMREELENILGEEWRCHETTLPIMASEDFSYYLEKIPGAFALIGSDDGEKQHCVPCHHTSYDFNDKLIPVVLRLFSSLVGLKIP